MSVYMWVWKEQGTSKRCVLYHHGIEGMQWGVKNGPPYPLSGKQRRTVKKRRDERIGQKTAGSAKKAGLIPEAIALTAVSVTPFIIKKIKEARTARADAKRDKGHEIKNLTELDQLKTLRIPQHPAQIVKEVNPEYNISDPSTSTNCSYCTVATELRSRGYNISAKHLSTGLNCRKHYSKMFKTPPPMDWSQESVYQRKQGETDTAYIKRRHDELCSNILNRSGNNSRGAIQFFVPGYGIGHIFNYSVDTKGKVRFLDGQSGNSDARSNIDNLPDSSYLSFVRLDNHQLSSEVVKAVRTP